MKNILGNLFWFLILINKSNMNVLKSLFLILVFISSQQSLSQLRIEITGGAEDPINIAVVPIDWRLESPQEEYLHEIIKTD